MSGFHLRQIVRNRYGLARVSYCQLRNSTKHLHSVRRLPCYKYISRPLLSSESALVINRTVSGSSKESSAGRHALLLAVYGSFAVGGCLLLAIFLRWFKKKRLILKGIHFVNVPEFKRLSLYKYKDYLLPEFVINNLENLENFETCTDDVWVVSFPRSGTTWLQEIVYLINSNVNTNNAETMYIDRRFPYLEFLTPGVKEIEKMQKPRLIKSHLPLSLLPKSIHEQKPKIIYIARNPKDVAVSYYYFVRLLYPVTRYDSDFKNFLDLFLSDKVMYAPWSKHVQEFHDKRHEDNIFFLTYEDLKKDTAGTISELATFLGKSLTEKQIDTIVKHCSFQSMKSNPATNHSWFETYGISDPKNGDFIRKGCVGDWANHFTSDMNDRMNKMVAFKFMNSDLSFSYRGTHFVSDDSVQESPE